MTDSRIMTMTLCLFASMVAAAQTPPARPTPPPPPAAPYPVLAPTPAPAPFPPAFPEAISDDMRIRLEEMQDRLSDMKLEKLEHLDEMIAPKIAEMQDRLLDMNLKEQTNMAFNFNFNKSLTPLAAFAPQQGMGMGQGVGMGRAGRLITGSDDRIYTAGQNALEAGRWTEALEYFNQVAARGGAKAEGAWYWKAYALNKLGRRDEANAAIAELRKSYASSRWLDDAKVLELEVKQSSGQPVSPESQSDDELKLLALQGLMQSDPDRAMPFIEKMLKGTQSPRIKRQAVYVLAQSPSPRAQQLLEQIAKGQGNPDMQLQAIRFIGSESRRRTGSIQTLFDIYNSSSDASVKRAILTAFENARDKDHLLQIAKSEKNQDLRLLAIRLLSSISGTQAEVWQLYQSEPTVEGRQAILESLPSNGNIDKLLEVAKADKEPKLRRYAIQNLGSTRAATTGDALAGMYASETDETIKRAIIDALSSQHNAKALIACGRAEKELKMKQRIVERLANMKSPEASEFLMEILK